MLKHPRRGDVTVHRACSLAKYGCIIQTLHIHWDLSVVKKIVPRPRCTKCGIAQLLLYICPFPGWANLGGSHATKTRTRTGSSVLFVREKGHSWNGYVNKWRHDCIGFRYPVRECCNTSSLTISIIFLNYNFDDLLRRQWYWCRWNADYVVVRGAQRAVVNDIYFSHHAALFFFGGERRLDNLPVT